MLLENQLEMSSSKAVNFLKKTKMQGGQRRFKSSRSQCLKINLVMCINKQKECHG